MCSVNFNDPEARFPSSTGGCYECSSDFPDSIDGERLRHRIGIGKTQCAWSDNILPPTGAFGDRSLTIPWPIGTRFASGMGQLHSGYAALPMNEADDPRQRLNMIVLPDTKILRTDTSVGKNGSCLGEHQCGATDGAAAQMDEMPVVCVSVGAGVFAHRRNKYAVRKCNIANRERIKQVRHRVLRCFSMLIGRRSQECGCERTFTFVSIVWRRRSAPRGQGPSTSLRTGSAPLPHERCSYIASSAANRLSERLTILPTPYSCFDRRPSSGRGPCARSSARVAIRRARHT